ncbi:RNA-protein complex protein Nop10 [Desulfurococcus mucosus]|uniref:Ribosome biogenesis protein Nop10 n=1 Tax=Desulfurococcus mucosus (strain ATCC 35584 / DSM 2162 / JCM 9187 / O7/1) TaxID=765177 RepID=E8RAF7_DESM0|nr:RNA-protein complex protein Nop10 [Desulfurococcus mucosus]ADV64367.1 RNA-binding protein Nop10p [Desulfurococcus mucosus DSM 2162]
MNWLMRKCVRCGSYTLDKEKCPRCGGELTVPHPARFSPVDKYATYRLREKLSSNLLKLDEKPPYVP